MLCQAELVEADLVYILAFRVSNLRKVGNPLLDFEKHYYKFRCVCPAPSPRVTTNKFLYI
jgi:hypothetical protein